NGREPLDSHPQGVQQERDQRQEQTKMLPTPRNGERQRQWRHEFGQRPASAPSRGITKRSKSRQEERDETTLPPNAHRLAWFERAEEKVKSGGPHIVFADLRQIVPNALRQVIQRDRALQGAARDALPELRGVRLHDVGALLATLFRRRLVLTRVADPR